jgi:hypothetical protein
MRNLNADRAGMNVHLSSMAPTSMGRDYHKILEAVKAGRITHDLWGSRASDRNVKDER